MATFSQQFLANLGRPAMTQGMFNLGSAIGGLPAQARAKKMEEERRKQLAGLDPNTVQGLQGLAQFYQSQGDLENAVKYAAASRNLAETLADKSALKSEQENLALRAETLGLPDVATRARTVTDKKSLDSIANDLRTMERAKVGTQSIPVRRRLAAAAGINKSQFDTLNLGTVSDADFNATVDGQKGKTEAWQDEQGNPGCLLYTSPSPTRPY